MKTLLALALVAAMASGTAASPYLNTYNGTLGLFFDDFTGRDPAPTWDQVTFNTNSNVETTSGFTGPFAWAYLVLMDPQATPLRLLEIGIFTDADWIEGWADNTVLGAFGGVFNSAEGDGNYSAVVTWAGGGIQVLPGSATALMRFKLRNWAGGDLVNVKLGPVTHITPGVAGRIVLVCEEPTVYVPVSPAVDWSEIDAQGRATVATLFGNEGDIVATEDHTLSNVKALFR